MNTIAMDATITNAHRALVLAIFRQAVRDTEAGNPARVTDACVFLASDGAADLAEGLGLSRDAPRRLAARLQGTQ